MLRWDFCIHYFCLTKIVLFDIVYTSTLKHLIEVANATFFSGDAYGFYRYFWIVEIGNEIHHIRTPIRVTWFIRANVCASSLGTRHPTLHSNVIGISFVARRKLFISWWDYQANIYFLNFIWWNYACFRKGISQLICAWNLGTGSELCNSSNQEEAEVGGLSRLYQNNLFHSCNIPFAIFYP